MNMMIKFSTWIAAACCTLAFNVGASKANTITFGRKQEV